MANYKCSSVPKGWAELSPNLLPLIAHKLDDIIDFIRLRAVCKQWRLATDLSDNPPQFPWLMILESYRNPNISFFALPSTKIFSIPFDFISTKISRGSNEFMLDKKHVGGFHNEHSNISLLDQEDYVNDHITIFSLMVNRLGCNVSGGDAVHFPPVGNISEFFAFKSNQLSEMHVPYMRYLAHHMERIFLYHYGDTTTRPHVVVLHDTTRDVVSTISCPNESVHGCWLISTRDGVLLVVHKNVPPQEAFNDVPYVDNRFVVYRLENYHDDKQPRWTKLSGIGDMMLFLDDCNAFSLMASDYEHGCRGNCIYFISHFKKNPIFFGSQCEYVLLGFDMRENRCFEVRSLGEATAFASKIYWFIPSHY
ncbi:uncharacterized protein LOC144549674 [Carex rostrata]